MTKLLSKIIAIPIIISLLSLILNAILALLLTLTYNTLTKENIVATIQFDKVLGQKKIYIAHLYSRTKLKIGDYKIYGDQWRIDAGFIKMKYWANILGIDSKYTLNRFEGRYKNIQDENNKKHQAYLIDEHNIIDIFNFFIDTRYGSSVYQDIKLDTQYIVLKSQTGLIVREKKVKNNKSLADKTKALFGY